MINDTDSNLSAFPEIIVWGWGWKELQRYKWTGNRVIQETFKQNISEMEVFLRSTYFLFFFNKVFINKMCQSWFKQVE